MTLRSCCGTSLISRPCGHFDRLCPRMCAVCHTDIATLQTPCQPAKSQFTMTEKDVEGDSEGILSILIKLNSLPKASSVSAKHFYIAGTLPLCITLGVIMFSMLQCKANSTTNITAHDDRLACLMPMAAPARHLVTEFALLMPRHYPLLSLHLHLHCYYCQTF